MSVRNLLDLQQSATASAQNGVSTVLSKVGPVISALCSAMDFLSPFVTKAVATGQSVWAVLAPYHPEELSTVGLGLILVFCGGYYPMLIAAVEAIKLCGYDKIHACVLQLWESYKAARDASLKDDQRDDNNDGIADVNQITKSELISRKILVVMTAIDPALVNGALSGLMSSTLAVLATLRMQMAKTVVLAAAIGDVFTKALDRFLRAPVESVTPPNLRKWVPIGLGWLARVIAMSVAYTAQRILSAFHSAVRGSQLVVKGLAAFGRRHGVPTDIVDEGTLAFTALTALVAFAGLSVQLQSGFGSPLSFPFSVILWPLNILEYLVKWGVYMFAT